MPELSTAELTPEVTLDTPELIPEVTLDTPELTPEVEEEGDDDEIYSIFGVVVSIITLSIYTTINTFRKSIAKYTFRKSIAKVFVIYHHHHT